MKTTSVRIHSVDAVYAQKTLRMAYDAWILVGDDHACIETRVHDTHTATSTIVAFSIIPRCRTERQNIRR